MHLLDFTAQTPAENLSCDAVLLQRLDQDPVAEETLRLWESPRHFVVLGISNQAETEVNVAACRADDIPILKRCTGGGTVLQGPGCLNYALILRIPESGPLTTIAGTNAWVMAKQASGLGLQVPGMEIQGSTDLTLNGKKFSGNAQRRGRHALLFHGTLLYDFNLELVGRYLQSPSRAPAYRQERAHSDFLCNLPVPLAVIKDRLRLSWAGAAAETLRCGTSTGTA